MYFDVELEYVHLRIRLHDDEYQPLAVDGLDEDRLALYMLAQRLSLTAGPLRLLDGGLPQAGVHGGHRRAQPEGGAGAGPRLNARWARCTSIRRAKGRVAAASGPVLSLLQVSEQRADSAARNRLRTSVPAQQAGGSRACPRRPLSGTSFTPKQSGERCEPPQKSSTCPPLL